MGLFDRTGIDLDDPVGGSVLMHVFDAMGSHLPEPVHETFEPDRLALTLPRWSNEGVDDEERFAFHSVWLAWTGARKLQAARQG